MWLKCEKALETNRQRACSLFSHQITENKLGKTGGYSFCSFRWQTLIETLGEKMTKREIIMLPRGYELRLCVAVTCISDSRLWALPLFPRMAHQTNIRSWFFHCQQMPACICISTLPLKRHPDFFTVYQHHGIRELSAAPINGSSSHTHQKHQLSNPLKISLSLYKVWNWHSVLIWKYRFY